MDDLSPAELREVRKAIRAAYERGRAAERREFDAFLARMRALKELNGSGDAFLKAYSDREQSREEERRPDPHAAVAEAMLAHAEEAMADGDDHLPGVEALRALLDDPAELGRVLADGGADDEAVGKAVWSVLKAYREADHPRGKNGRFIGKDRIDAAKSDPKLAKKLKEEVKPEDAGKLDAALEGKTDLGRTKRGEARHQAGQRRATREEARAKTAKFMTHLKRVGDLKAELTADDLHDLADHLGDPHVTLDDVRAMRHALAGAGAGRASFGGKSAKDDMVKALQSHARRAGFEARMKEHGIGGADAEDMRAAAGSSVTPSSAMADEVREYAKLGYSAGECNSGECEPIARRVVGRVRGAGGDAAFGSPRDNPAHVWVVSGGKHYDAQHPAGVDDPSELTFFQDNPDLLENGWKQTRESPVGTGKTRGEEAPAPGPAERTPPATGGQYGAWGRAAAGEATAPDLAPPAAAAAAKHLNASPVSSVADLRAKLGGVSDEALAAGLGRLADAGKVSFFADASPEQVRSRGGVVVDGEPVSGVMRLTDVTPADLAAAFAGGAAPEATEDMLAGKAPLPDMSTLSATAEPAPAAEPAPPGKAPRRKPASTRKPAGKPPASPTPPAPGFGDAGPGHPMAAAKTRDDKIRLASELARRAQADGRHDVGGVGDPSRRPDFLTDAARDDILGAVGRHQLETTTGTDLPGLYEAVGRKHGLTKHQFQRALVHMDDAGDVRLKDWPRMIDEVPDPDLLTWIPGDPTAMYHVRLPNTADPHQAARLGDPSVNTAAVRSKLPDLAPPPAAGGAGGAGASSLPPAVESKPTGVATNEAEAETEAGAGRAGLPDPGRGGVGGGGAGGDAGGAGAGAARPRVVTARGEHTKRGDPGLVPEAVRPHLSEHQAEGAALAIDAVTRHGGFLLADGTGVGKTRQQLAVAKHFLDQGKKVVIVSPAEVIKPNWGKGTMSGSWAADSAAMGVPVRLGKGDAAPTPGAARVTTYNELAKLKNHVDKDTVVIWDEAHSLKNAASARAKHAKEINDAAGGALFATATPGDKPLHVAYLAKAGVFGTAGKAKTYEKLGMELHDQHVGGGKYQKVWRVDPRVGYREAARRIGGLFDQMTRDGLMVKRELSMDGVEMGTDHVPLTPDQHAEVDRVYKDALARTGGNKAVALMAARLHQEPMKVPHAVSAVREELAAGRSPVVFLGRVNDIGEDADDADDADADAAGGRAASEGTARALKAALVAAGVPEADIGELHGGATKTPEQKKRAMDDFQANRKKVMIATVASGGTGINLDDTTGTRPRTVVMMTPPFTANDMAQAVGRVHRLNTKSAAKVRGVLSDTNIDHWNAALLARKFQTLGAFARGETGRARDAVRPEGAPDAGGDEKPYEWGESLLDTRHYADTPFAHNDVVGRFGGQRVNRGTRDAPQWTTAFPSRERYEAYRQHVAATPPAAGAAAGGVASRLVQTSQGPRHVHSFTPGKAYWDRVHKIRPDYVSIRKDERTGQWQGSVWGRTPEEVARNVADLKRRGGY